jgi:hypothetical protein
MKLAAPPCGFIFYNEDNPEGEDKSKYYVSGFTAASARGPTSGVVSGNLHIDEITVEANLEVTLLGIVYEGSASFVFPAKHWAFMLDGHATLAVEDAVVSTARLIGYVAMAPTEASFAITAKLASSGQSTWDDYSNA